MNNHESILLSLLHSAGCTHRDFRKIFLFSGKYIEKVYNEILIWNPIYENIIPKNRHEKICHKLNKLDYTEQKNFLETHKISITHFFDNHYPEKLKHAY